MSAVSVLQSFSPSAMPGPVMPMDVAMRFYISHSPPPLSSFLSSYEDLQRARNQANHGPQAHHHHHHHHHRAHQLQCKPLRPCLSTQQRAPEDEEDEDEEEDEEDDEEEEEVDDEKKKKSNGARRDWASAKAAARKKRVVFADSKGMSLTAVHVFSRFDEDTCRDGTCFCGGGDAGDCGAADELQFHMADLEAATLELKTRPARGLALDFRQPSSDYLDFRNRLIGNKVCLENCLLQERSLTGTVKVRNVGFEKAVCVRATFDSWAGYTDVDCTFMNNVYGCPDTDTFSFALDLPADILPQNRVEFCICYTAQGQTFWDNNDGGNYRLKHVGWNGEEVSGGVAGGNTSSTAMTPGSQGSPEHKHGGGKPQPPGVEFDQFGSPRMSSDLFPGWQSWGQIENSVPYW